MWNQDHTKTLIQLYEQHECLYLISSVHYKNKTKRRMALEEITTNFNNLCNTDVTWDVIQKKINGLRTTYTSELNKLKKSEHSGAGLDDVYVSTWWCFELLNFLHHRQAPHNATKNVSSINHAAQGQAVEVYQGEVDSEKDELIYEGTIDDMGNFNVGTPHDDLNSQSPITVTPISQKSTKKRKRESATGDIQYELLKASTSALTNISGAVSKSENDPTKNFCKNIESEMRMITDRNILREVKRQIMMLIYDAQEKEN
uniref:MADF domain-containing protein n=1 Tax=Photinus pyralis TaxID=7054 RepID=A0A1Y1KVA1_PHOPY